MMCTACKHFERRGLSHGICKLTGEEVNLFWGKEYCPLEATKPKVRTVKAFNVRLGFDMEYFDDSKLTLEFVERTVRSRLSGEGVSITVDEVGILRIIEGEYRCEIEDCKHNEKGYCSLKKRTFKDGLCLSYETTSNLF